LLSQGNRSGWPTISAAC